MRQWRCISTITGSPDDRRHLELQTLRRKFDSVVRPRGTVFYGWWIVLGTSGIQLLAGSLWMQSYGAYAVLLQEDFGWSKTLIAGAFALTRVESGVLGPFQGWLCDRFGPRVVLHTGTIMFGIGFMLFSQIQSVLSFYLTFALIAVGSSLGGFATLMVSIVNWFDRHRAKAVALSQTGYSLGGLCVPIVVFALEGFGWRTTALASGVIVICVGLPLAQIVRHRPEPYGQTPDGVTASPTNMNSVETLNRTLHFSPAQAIRTRAFWLTSIGHSLALLTVSAVMVHLFYHLTVNLDYSFRQAGFVIAMMTGCQMVGQLLGGFLGDRFDKRLLCSLCMLGHASGLALVAYAQSPLMVIGFALLHGLGWGTRGPLMVALRADYFGATSFGTIMGISSLIVMVGMSSGAIIAG
ncbi:MAG: MFS transporter, partial [Pseudomonadales bacterium]